MSPPGWADQKTSPPPVEERVSIADILDSVDRLVEPPRSAPTYSTADTVHFPGPDDPDRDLSPATLQSEIEGGPTIPQLDPADTDVSNPNQGRRNAEAIHRLSMLLRRELPRVHTSLHQLLTHQATHPEVRVLADDVGQLTHRVGVVEGTHRAIGARLNSQGLQIWILVGFAAIGYAMQLASVSILLAVLTRLAQLVHGAP